MLSREEEIYAAAIELEPTERHAYLERACGNDTALRRRLEALVAADEEADEFFAETPVTRPAGVPEEKPGDGIGRYKLLQKIGEGCCGVVYMAEQEDPVRRRVALKIIKLGMDTKAVIARFEAERQALALMEHPNIARVLDAGATETGRPFFAMELVRGIPITRHCDSENLTTAARLGLFVQVCHAIQHAHEKGIVHRDIKPSNILVTMHDDVAVPKVIDFGIAKATQGRLTDKTVFTAFEQFIGTPAYMSPEQAQMNDIDVDTRSDIYSLGVLLYELLTGRPPFDPKTLERSGIDEIRRIIREVDPPRPSTRLTTLSDEDRAKVAKLRGTAPAQLSTLVHGDLDWIAMKAIEKNRTRRYETASGLAADIRKHLSHEPVLARPPSALYRLEKFAARHKFGLLAAVAVLVALGAGLTLSQVVFRERTARDSANAPAAMEEVRSLAIAEPPVAPAQSDLVVRQVPMAKFPGTWGAAAVSPDGRYFIYGGEGDLIALFDVAKQSLRKLARANRGVCFSADSSQVAFINSEREQGAEVRTINLDGTGAQTVAKFTTEALDKIWLHAWSSDHQQFAVVTRKSGAYQIALIGAADGKMRTLRSTGTHEPGRAQFSPDGRWLVYDISIDEKGMNSDLFVVEIATGNESALVSHKADDHLMGWCPASNAVLFSSNRRGNYDAWLIRCVAGKAEGEPVLVKSDLGEPEPIGFTNGGAFYYAHRQWDQDVYSLTVDPKTGLATGAPVKAVDRFEGTNSAASWSPDGRKLAYSSRQPPFLIRILDPATQEDRIVAEGLYHAKWSPDGKSLLCFSQWDGEEKKLYIVDLATGTRTVIDDGKPAGSLLRAYQWALDAGSIYYQYHSASGVAAIVRRELATGREEEIQRVEGGGFFAISPDGRAMVFRKHYSLYLVPVSGGEPKLLWECPTSHYTPGWDVFTWSADGRAVLVCVWQINHEAEHLSDNITSELVRVPVDGGEPEAILNIPRVRYPHAHPDGTRITFSAGRPRLELWVIENFLPLEKPPSAGVVRSEAPGEPRSLLVEAPPSTTAARLRKVSLPFAARWFMTVSDDGKYVGYMPVDTLDLAVADLTKGKSWTLVKGTRESSVQSGAVISPDGQWIAYDMDGETIHISRLDGSEARVVHERDRTTAENLAEALESSADGNELIIRLWFTREATSLLSVNVKTGAKTEIGRVPQNATWLTLSPDRQYLVGRQGSYPRRITLRDLKSGHEETLVDQDADRIIGWAPGSSRVLFSKTTNAGLGLWAVEIKAGQLAGKPEQLWSNWDFFGILGITRDGNIYYSVQKEQGSPVKELWVMEGFLRKPQVITNAAKLPEIPPEEILGEGNSIHDRKLGLFAVIPPGWTVQSAVLRWSSPVINFSLPEKRAVATLAYHSTASWEVPGALYPLKEMGSKPASPDEIDAWLRKWMQARGASRIEKGDTSYRLRPENVVSRVINGHPTLSWAEDFTIKGEKWVEFVTINYSENVFASCWIRTPTAASEAVRLAFEQLVESLRLP